MFWQPRQGLICGRAALDGAAGAAPTTWNPSDKDGSITLSGGNLTFTGSGSGRATNPLSTGKAYWEVLIVQDSGEAGGAFNVGFTDGTTTFADMRSSGIINMVFLFNGNIGNSAVSLGAIVNSDVICIAVDLGAKKSWFRKNGGNWNASALNDPATAVGGITFGPSGPYYANAAGSAVGTQFTANFGASAFSFTTPSGFTSWNGLV